MGLKEWFDNLLEGPECSESCEIRKIRCPFCCELDDPRVMDYVYRHDEELDFHHRLCAERVINSPEDYSCSTVDYALWCLENSEGTERIKRINKIKKILKEAKNC